jgi:alpha-tubulin suppressor-like RCC1 family protein
MDGPLAQLPLDLLELVLGFIDDGIKSLVRLASCSHQFQSSVKDVVNSKVVSVIRDGEIWMMDVLMLIELRDGWSFWFDKPNVTDFGLALSGVKAVQVSHSPKSNMVVTILGEPRPHGLDNMLPRWVDTGEYHTVLLTVDGSIYTFDRGANGLGHGTYERQLIGERVVSASAGEHHTVMLTEGGDILTFGCGVYGTKGHRAYKRQFIGERVAAVATGCSHTVVLTASGAVFTFGSGKLGQLGHGNLQRQLSPMRVEALAGHRVVHITAGRSHTAVLTDKGVVLTFGYDSLGQLGRATRGYYYSHLPGEVEVLAGERVVSLSAGDQYTILVTSSGRVVTVGMK